MSVVKKIEMQYLNLADFPDEIDEQNNIKVYPGVNMSTDEAVDMYLKGTLKFSETATCNHQDGGHDCNHPCSK